MKTTVPWKRSSTRDDKPDILRHSRCSKAQTQLNTEGSLLQKNGSGIKLKIQKIRDGTFGRWLHRRERSDRRHSNAHKQTTLRMNHVCSLSFPLWLVRGQSATRGWVSRVVEGTPKQSCYNECHWGQHRDNQTGTACDGSVKGMPEQLHSFATPVWKQLG